MDKTGDFKMISYEKPTVSKVASHDSKIAVGVTLDPTTCIPLPGFAYKGFRFEKGNNVAAKPLVLDADGNPVIYKD